jgi:uncharacterized protein
MALTIKTLSIVFCEILLFSGVYAQSHYPGQHQDKIKIKGITGMKAFAFDLPDVKLLDSRFKENMERESAWILSIDVNSLLLSFRTNAGLPVDPGYSSFQKPGGWEALECEVRGHTTGHVLSGLALLYASTGKEVYKVKADSIVRGLAEVQKKLNQKGYLSAFPQNFINRLFCWLYNRNDSGKIDIFITNKKYRL